MKMTKPQREYLEHELNKDLVAVARLPDGDLLVLDTTLPEPGPFREGPGHFGPYVLTRGGRLQGVNLHYRYYHEVDVPSGLSREGRPSTKGYRGGTW